MRKPTCLQTPTTPMTTTTTVSYHNTIAIFCGRIKKLKPCMYDTGNFLLRFQFYNLVLIGEHTSSSCALSLYNVNNINLKYLIINPTYMNGSSQYSLNIVTRVSSTILALFRSVAVDSMKTFLVSMVILLWSPKAS